MVINGRRRKRKYWEIPAALQFGAYLSIPPSVHYTQQNDGAAHWWLVWLTNWSINWLLFHLLLGALMVDWSVVWLARSLTVVWLLAGLFDWLIDWLAGDMQVPHLWFGTMTAKLWKLWTHKYTRLKQNSIDSTSLSVWLMRVRDGPTMPETRFKLWF